MYGVPALTPAEQQAIKYQQIVATYEKRPDCECKTCHTVRLMLSIPIEA